MTVIICVDDRGGLLFNKRRVSSDQMVTERILVLAEGKPIRMNKYSAALFEGGNLRVDEDFLNLAESEDICFVEDRDLAEYIDRIDRWILYRWNRRYPSDFKFDFSLLNGKTKISAEEFEGKSHPKITEEIYQ